MPSPFNSLSEQIDANAISSTAEHSIYQAINNNKLVALTGSGISRAFLHPSWELLAKWYLEICLKLYAKAEPHSRDQAKNARRNLSSHIGLLPDDPIKEQLFDLSLSIRTESVIELCSRVLQSLENGQDIGDRPLDVARRMLCKRLASKPDKIAQRRLNSLLKSNSKRRKIHENRFELTDLEKPGFLAYLLYILHDFGNEPEIASFLKTHAKLDSYGEGEDNPLSAICQPEGIGCRRIATLNYDTTVENYLLDHLKNEKQLGRNSSYEGLLTGRAPLNSGGAAISVEDGTGRHLISQTLSTNSISDLINFSAYSQAYDRQVFHIHGRVDQPDSVIFSQQDYQSRYLNDESHQRIFREAQEIFFGSNYLLLIGIGLGETDIMQPFRQLLSRQLEVEFGRRRLFALMPSVSISDTKERNHQNRLLALQNAYKYNIYTIFYGHQDLYFPCYSRKLHKSGVILKDITRSFWDKGQFTVGAGPDVATYKQNLTKAIEQLQEIVKFNDKIERLIDFNDEQSLISDHLIPQLQQLQTATTPICRDTTLLRLRAAVEIVDELSTRVQTRYMIQRLRQIGGNAGRRQSEWCHGPGERLARVPASDYSDHGPVGWIRHRTTRPVHFASVEKPWAILNELQKVKPESRGRRRILRLSCERGGGKGSLISLLSQNQNRQYLFQQRTEYSGSFVAHLSFSNEFSSIIMSLSRFFAYHLARIHWDQFSRTFKNQICQEIRQRWQLPAGLLELNSPLANYCYTREEEPRLAIAPLAITLNDLPTEQEKPHRLDLLHRISECLQNVNIGETKFFVLLGGLDKICDRNGDAYNPMHRLFFRMLIGHPDFIGHALDLPLDIVLLAGSPNTPISYLSEVVERQFTNPLEARQYAQTSKTGRWLKRWQLLPAFSWRERYHLALPHNVASAAFHWADKFANHRTGATGIDSKLQTGGVVAVGYLLFLFERNGHFRSITFAADSYQRENLHQLLWRNVSLSLWIINLLQRQSFERPGFNDLINFLNRLDNAANPYHVDGILDILLNQNLCVKMTIEDKQMDVSSVARIVMQHMTLFTSPVQVWVLLGCPEIERCLEFSLKKCLQNTSSAGTDMQEKRWRRRSIYVEVLIHILDTLADRGMTTRVLPACRTWQSADVNQAIGDESPHAQHRYVLHNRLREFLAKKMRLSIPDAGESNFFQCSIYCSQPRDLPTPSTRHFDMVSEMIDGMIRHSRLAIHAADSFNQLTHYGELIDEQYLPNILYGEEFPDKLRQRFAKVVARRVFAPQQKTETSWDPGGDLIRLLCVPQRLRACISLVRSTFSIGTISRLGTLGQSNSDELPFEAYRAWLRSITNLATIYELNRYEFNQLLQGKLLPKNCDQNSYCDADEIDNESVLESLDKSFRPYIETSTELRDDFLRFDNDVRKQARAQSLTQRQSCLPIFQTAVNPFYRDEIAWLFNERGLTSFLQGRVHDALPQFERALAIMHHVRRPQIDSHAFHSGERRILFNYAVTLIDAGRLSTARRLLEQIRQSTSIISGSTPSETYVLAGAYIALCDHLSGAFQKANEGYERAIDTFVKHERHRATAIFNRHLCDLLSFRGMLADARIYCDHAIAAASNSAQQDVLHAALLSKARLLLSDGDIQSATDTIEMVKQYSERMGLYGLAAAAYCEEGQMLLQRGEIGLAGLSTARSIALCSRNGLRLRKLGTLYVYSKIQQRRKEFNQAKVTLVEVKRECERAGYQTVADRCTELLGQLAPY